MQIIRQILTSTIQRPIIFERSTLIIQQIRFDGSDPRSSTSSDNHKNKQQSDSIQSNDLKQSETIEEERNKLEQDAGNESTYGKAGRLTDEDNTKH